MARYHVFSTDHEIPGKILIDLENAVESEDIIPFFTKHGMTNIDPQAWYPMQKLLDIYNDMVDSRNASTMFDFVSIGMKEAEQAIVPSQFQTMPLLEILKSVTSVFDLNNRGTDYGSCVAEAVTDKHMKITLRAATPDDIWYGVFYGFVRRFAPKGTQFSLRYDPDIPRRENGGEVTIIHITWD